MTSRESPTGDTAGYETEWSDESLSLIFARYARPIPHRPRSRWSPHWPSVRGKLAARLVPVATDLACVVHGDGDVDDVARLIWHRKPAELRALCVVLAAGWDVERTTDEVLGWTAWEKREPEPCGTPGAYRRHLRHGERCDVCLDAHNAGNRAAAGGAA